MKKYKIETINLLPYKEVKLESIYITDYEKEKVKQIIQDTLTHSDYCKLRIDVDMMKNCFTLIFNHDEKDIEIKRIVTQIIKRFDDITYLKRNLLLLDVTK